MIEDRPYQIRRQVGSQLSQHQQTRPGRENVVQEADLRFGQERAVGKNHRPVLSQAVWAQSVFAQVAVREEEHVVGLRCVAEGLAHAPEGDRDAACQVEGVVGNLVAPRRALEFALDAVNLAITRSLFAHRR